jgi:predicted nuclease with TOPRIM domain
LLEKIKKLEADKNFYEEALEARTNQLEEMEQRCEDLEAKLAISNQSASTASLKTAHVIPKGHQPIVLDSNPLERSR